MGEAFGCVKNTIRLRSGRYFDFIDPQPDQFTLGDIAGALSKICRFGGQIDRFYSVAEHLVHCAEQAAADGLSEAACLALFCHDMTEAFCGDMVKPLKIMLPQYSEVEDRVEAVIERKFGVRLKSYRDAIRGIDHAMLIAERRALFSADDVTWAGESEARKLNVVFGCWTPEVAEREFLGTARVLGLKDEVVACAV